MAAKNSTQVIIGGKIYTVGGFESEEYLQRIAGYLNGKITELRSIEGYTKLTPDMKSLLLSINVADDYYKIKDTADQLSAALTQKDKELYEIKRELIAVQMQLENASRALEDVHEKA